MRTAGTLISIVGCAAAMLAAPGVSAAVVTYELKPMKAARFAFPPGSELRVVSATCAAPTAARVAVEARDVYGVILGKFDLVAGEAAVAPDSAERGIAAVTPTAQCSATITVGSEPASPPPPPQPRVVPEPK